MGNSIQDYLKKINSRLSFFDITSIAVTALFLIFCSAYLLWSSEKTREDVMYRTIVSGKPSGEQASRPYGSKNGTTYTYSWCQGGSRVKPENMVYYESAEAAEKSGRRISKLCQK